VKSKEATTICSTNLAKSSEDGYGSTNGCFADDDDEEEDDLPQKSNNFIFL
jgi:hypothetical protein